MHLLRILLLFFCAIAFQTSFCQSKNDTSYLLIPDRVFDGEQMHQGWKVVIKNNTIISAGLAPDVALPSKTIELKGCTLLPGLIEGHSHLFLHPYNETCGTTRC